MSKKSSDEKKRLAVAGAAGITPFAGLIGETKKLDPMKGKRYATLSELAQQAKKGDVLMAGAPGTTLSGGFNKTFINLGIGKPAGYHPTIVEGVTPDGRITILEQGPNKGWQRKTLSRDSHSSLSLLRQKSQEGAAGTVDTARRYVAANEKLGAELLKRGLSQQEVLRIQKQAYSHRMNPAIGFRELFLPKGHAKRSVSTQRAGAGKALHFFEQNTAQIAENLANKSKAGKKITLSDLKCLGGVCTTAAAQAGVPVRQGTNILRTSPNDILGSGQLRNVAYKRASNAGNLGQRALHGVLRHGPNLVRGAAGVGLGALAYQGAKKIWPDQQKTAASKEEIHALADKKGIPWDDDAKFMRWSKALTGQTCLDKMSPGQLSRIKQALHAKKKIAAAAPQVDDYKGEATTGAAGAALMAPKAIEPALGKTVTRYKPGKPIHIYYTDPARGAGHYHQAKNLGEALKAKGIPFELINVEKKFTTPAARQRLLKTYKRVMNGEISHNAWKREWTKFYLTQVDKRALKMDARRAGGVILTNPGIAPWMRGAMPANIVVSDPSKAMIDTPLGTSWTRAQDTKYVPETIKGGYKGPNIRRVTNVPLDPEMFSAERAPSPFDPKRAHVTVSGGGTGTDVLKQVEQLMGSKTQQIKGKPVTIHAVAGNLRTRAPFEYNKLLEIAEQSGGKLVVHDKLPHDQLRPMLRNADLNVMRPHGTMGTEAVVAKKPMIYSARGGVAPGGGERYVTGMNTANARKFSELTGAPMGGTGGATTRANLGQLFDTHAQQLEKLQPGVDRAASKFTDTATSITDDIIKRPRIKAPGRIPFSKQMAIAGGVLAGGAGLHAMYERFGKKKAPPMKKVSMPIFERRTMTDLQAEGYERGLTKSAAIMGMIKTAGFENMMPGQTNYNSRGEPTGPYRSYYEKGTTTNATPSTPKSQAKRRIAQANRDADAKDTRERAAAAAAAKPKSFQAKPPKVDPPDPLKPDLKKQRPVAPLNTGTDAEGHDSFGPSLPSPGGSGNFGAPGGMGQYSGKKDKTPPKVSVEDANKGMNLSVPKPQTPPASKATPNTSAAATSANPVNAKGPKQPVPTIPEVQKPIPNAPGTSPDKNFEASRAENMKGPNKKGGWLERRAKDTVQYPKSLDTDSNTPGTQDKYMHTGSLFPHDDNTHKPKPTVAPKRGTGRRATAAPTVSPKPTVQPPAAQPHTPTPSEGIRGQRISSRFAQRPKKELHPRTTVGSGRMRSFNSKAEMKAYQAELAKARKADPSLRGAGMSDAKDKELLTKSQQPKGSLQAKPRVEPDKGRTTYTGNAQTGPTKKEPPKVAPPITDELAGSPAHVDSQGGRTTYTGNAQTGAASPPAAQAGPKVEPKTPPEVDAPAKPAEKPAPTADNLFRTTPTPTGVTSPRGRPTGAVEDTKGGKPVVERKVQPTTPTSLKPNRAAPAYVPSMIRDAQTAVGKVAPTAVPPTVPKGKAPTVTRQDSDVNTPGVNTKTRGSTSVTRDGNRTVTTTRSNTSGNVSVASLKGPQRKAYQGMQVSLNKAIGIKGNTNLSRTMANMAMSQALAKGWDPSTGAAGWEKADPRGFARMKKKYPAAFAQ